MINLFFFQNCISPHQIPYIKKLPLMKEVNKVYVVVPESDLIERKKMGWDSESIDTNNIKILVNPQYEDIKDLYKRYNDQSTWCLFSGISSFQFVKKYFILSLEYNYIKRAIITEPPFLFNHPLWLHKIRFAINDWRYVKYIDKLFVMGDDFIKYYEIWSKKWEIIPFMYCTEWIERKNINFTIKNNDKLKILFVGSLSKRKNVQLIFKSLNLLNPNEQEKIEIGIIGDGEEKSKLILLSENKKYKTTFYGIKQMAKVYDIMQEYDILCLPSLHDGWGAVVNEGITLGLYALCSDTCGSKYIIKESNYLCGEIFKNNDSIDLKIRLRNCLLSRNIIKDNISKRISWAKENIKDDIVAKYLITNLQK